ncbi:MAG: creatininase family protein [Candidatus Anstonellaceae archaeon]
MKKALLFGEMTSKQIARIAKQKNKPVVILPMGATEAHGPHLPLLADSITPFELAKKVSQQTNALVLPPLNYGFCYTLRPWAGTISLTSSTFAGLIRDITKELVRNGFDKILFLNGHGANASIASQALKELADEIRFQACIVSWWELPTLKKELGSSIGHADENEASIIMALTGWKKVPVKQMKSKIYFGRLIPMPKDSFTKLGYMGQVGKESSKKGKQMEKIIVKQLVELVNANLLLEQK